MMKAVSRYIVGPSRRGLTHGLTTVESASKNIEAGSDGELMCILSWKQFLFIPQALLSPTNHGGEADRFADELQGLIDGNGLA